MLFRSLGTSPVSVELIAGNHALTVTAEGFEKVDRSFVMQTTRATEMTISLRPVSTGLKEPAKEPVVTDVPKAEPKKDVVDTGTPPPMPPVVVTPVETKKGRLWTYVAGGVAVASLGTAIGLGVGANGNAAELKRVEHTQMEAQNLYNSANGMATGANVAYGVAGVALATAVVLFFVEK